MPALLRRSLTAIGGEPYDVPRDEEGRRCSPQGGGQLEIPVGGHIEIISFGESAVADQGAGDAGEGEEVVGLAFVAAVQTSASGEPGHGAFDGPAVTAESLRGFDALAGDAVPDASAG